MDGKTVAVGGGGSGLAVAVAAAVAVGLGVRVGPALVVAEAEGDGVTCGGLATLCRGTSGELRQAVSKRMKRTEARSRLAGARSCMMKSAFRLGELHGVEIVVTSLLG